MHPSQRLVGPVVESALAVLRSRPEYAEFQQGGSRKAFSEFLDCIAAELIAEGLPAEDVHFAKRYPRSTSGFVADSLRTLQQSGVLRHCDYDSERYDAIKREMELHHLHGSFRTYIYPEEARLLYAIIDIEKPRRVVFLGSYYGYWAHAALTAIAAAGGTAVLVDPDPVAQDVARSNLLRASLLGRVEIAICTGQEFMDRSSGRFDMVVLDAEGPRDHADPQQRGKRIYEPLLRHALPRIEAGALLACHNILFTDIADCDWFDGIIRRNHADLDPFLKLVETEFEQFVECTSTEGVGVGRLRSS